MNHFKGKQLKKSKYFYLDKKSNFWGAHQLTVLELNTTTDFYSAILDLFAASHFPLLYDFFQSFYFLDSYQFLSVRVALY